MNGPELPLLLVHAGATCFMTGLVWFVQVVHYPLYARVSQEAFVPYELDHTRRTGWVVAPMMGVELLSAGLLVVLRPEAVPAALVWLGLALVTTIWLSTFALQVPRHTELSQGFDAAAHAALVRSNWVRTALWSLRSALALAMLAAAASL